MRIIAAKAQGASKIVVFDLSEERLDKAKVVGAKHVFNSGKVNPLEVARGIEPEGFDVSFDVAGVEITLNQAIKLRSHVVWSLLCPYSRNQSIWWDLVRLMRKKS